MVDLVLGIVGGGRCVDALQPRDRAPGPGRQGGARTTSICASRSSGGLVRRARWLLGTGLSMLGWPLQVVALLLAPLVVVQPALAVGLLVLLFLAERMLGEHAGRNEHLGDVGDRARRDRRRADGAAAQHDATPPSI